jgi:hypothetical protein
MTIFDERNKKIDNHQSRGETSVSHNSVSLFSDRKLENKELGKKPHTCNQYYTDSKSVGKIIQALDQQIKAIKSATDQQPNDNNESTITNTSFKA